MLDLTEQLERYAAALGDAVPKTSPGHHRQRRFRFIAIAAVALAVIGVAGALVLNTGRDEISVGSDGGTRGSSEEAGVEGSDGGRASDVAPTADALRHALAVVLPTYEVEVATDENPVERVFTQVTVRSGGTIVSVVVLDAEGRSAFIDQAASGGTPPVTLRSGAMVIRDGLITTQVLYPLSKAHTLNFAAQAYGPGDGQPLSVEELDEVAAEVSEVLRADDAVAGDGVADGTVEGTLQLVGGRAGANPVPVPGTVEAQRLHSNETFTVAASSDGRFHIDLEPGEYRLVGWSPQYSAGGEPCRAEEVVEIRAGEISEATVDCHTR